MSDNVTVEEQWEAMDLSIKNGGFGNGQSTAAKTFVVSGTSDEREACYTAYVKAPSRVNNPYGSGGIPRSSASVVERCDETTWKIRVDYALTTSSGGTSTENRLNGDSQNDMSFDCSASTMHMLRPYDQICVYSNKEKMTHEQSKSIPIGWNGSKADMMEATGVDVVNAEIRERYTKVMKYREVTSTSWKRKVLHCFGRVNGNSFKGWEPGEALFVGCSYQTPLKGVDNVVVTFDFLIRENENAEFMGQDVGLTRGHEYLWVVYDKDDTDKETGMNKIKYIFKAKVFKGADFKKLGL